ncbi:MAG: substrate-binding domain-containing protein [Terriglobales bacterium]
MLSIVLVGASLFATTATAVTRISIAYIPRSTGNPYYDGVIDGFRHGCEVLGCDFTAIGPATADATSQIPFVAAQTQRGVNVIAVTPNSPDALNPMLDRARRRGTPVFSINSDMPGNQSHRDAAILPVDFTKIGPAQVELMGSLIGYAGDIAILTTTTDAPDQNLWVEDMRRVLAGNPKYARMKLVTVAYGNDDPQKSTTETEALLTNYPSLKGIIAPTAVGLAAAAQAVETAKKVGQVKVTGLGTPNQMRRFIQNGTVAAFQLWSPYNEGLLAAYFVVGVKNGTIKNAPGTSFEVPGIGKIKIGDNNVINTQADLTTFDKSNINQFHF